MAKKPVRRVRKDQDKAWAQHQGGSDGMFSSAEDVDAAWSLSGANQAPVSIDYDDLPAEYFLPTHELETIVATELKGSAPYEAAQKVLLERPREYQPGQSGGEFYKGAGMPGLNGGK